MRWILLSLVLITGCSHSLPPPAPTMLVFSWNATGTIPGIDLSNYVLRDATTGKVIATPAIGTLQYVLTPLPSPGLKTYVLTVSGRDAVGNFVTSLPAIVTIEVP